MSAKQISELGRIGRLTEYQVQHFAGIIRMVGELSEQGAQSFFESGFASI